MYQLSVFIHILSAIIWVGGMFFLALVIVPTTRRLPPAERGVLLGGLGRRFRVVGWTCIGLLIVSGIVNSAYRGLTWESFLSGAFLASRFGQILGTKLLLVLALIVLSVVHDFFVGPASVRALESPEAYRPEQIERLRRQASGIGRLSGVLAILIVLLAVGLVRGLPW